MNVHFVGKIVYQLKYIFGFNKFNYFIKNSIKDLSRLTLQNWKCIHITRRPFF